MARKLLVPVFPSERFYDAVVAAADVVAQEDGLITFLFTDVRPPGDIFSDDAEGNPSVLELGAEAGEGEIDARDVEQWRAQQVAALEDARQILYQRGVNDDRIDYAFADFADRESAGQAIADEAAAGAYDAVVLAKGYLEEGVDDQGSPPQEVLETIEKSVGGEVSVMVV